MEPKALVEQICSVLSEKKAANLVSIEVSDMTVVTDYFVIASGRSTTQVKGLYENLDEAMEKIGVTPIRTEGIAGAKWIAMDYGSVIVHLFLEETRQFYHLDRLWDKGNNVTKYE